MKRGELYSALLAVVIGGPLVYMFAQAITDGQGRAQRAPLEALLGTEAYEALDRGERTALNYMGNERTAPDFTLRDRHGRPWSLSDHRGKVVLMNFWSITCPPCVEEMPSFLELARILDGRDDVELVAISTDDGWDDVSRIFPANMELDVLFDPDSEVATGKFGSRLFPETWIIDPEGVIRLRIDGPRDWSSAIVLELIDRYGSG